MVSHTDSDGNSVAEIVASVAPWLIMAVAFFVGVGDRTVSDESATVVAGLILAPICAIILFFTLALVDRLITVHAHVITDGKCQIENLIFSRLFTPVEIRADVCIPSQVRDDNASDGVTIFNYANFFGATLSGVYALLLLILVPKLIWVVVAVGVWIGLVYLARSVFRVKGRLGTHIEDPNAHKENK